MIRRGPRNKIKGIILLLYITKSCTEFCGFFWPSYLRRNGLELEKVPAKATTKIEAVNQLLYSERFKRLGLFEGETDKRM